MDGLKLASELNGNASEVMFSAVKHFCKSHNEQEDLEVLNAIQNDKFEYEYNRKREEEQAFFDICNKLYSKYGKEFKKEVSENLFMDLFFENDGTVFNY